MKMNVQQALVTWIFWFYVILANTLALIITIPYYLIGIYINPRETYKGCRLIIKKVIAGFVAEMMVTCGFWNIEIIDNRHFKGEGPYIIVCNHKSIIDTLFTALLPFDDIVFTWKKKWSYVPGFGQLCLLSNHIPIGGENNNQGLFRPSVLDKASIELNNGSSVLFYSEGTRNPSKGLLPFKTGAFRLAQYSDIQIIPVTLIGTFQACSGFICNRSRIKMIIDEPIYIQDINQGILDVRSVILNNLNKYNELNNLRDLGRSNKNLLKLK